MSVVRGREEFSVLRGEVIVKPPAGETSKDLSISYTQNKQPEQAPRQAPRHHGKQPDRQPGRNPDKQAESRTMQQKQVINKGAESAT